MNLNNSIILLALSVCLSSCFIRGNRGFYDQEKSEYNLEKAKMQLKQLKEGVLIVSIPTEKQKLKLLEKTDPNKHKEVQAELDFLKENFIEAMSSFYTYSDYLFIADSDLTSFLKRNETEHFLNSEGTSNFETNIDTSSNYFVLKSFRDFDQAFIYDKNNKYPNKPFPYESTLRVGEFLLSDDYYTGIKKKYYSSVSEAIYILNYRLTKRNNIHN